MTATRSGAGMALIAMLCVQLGIAASVGLFDEVGPDGAACLRLVFAGLILVAVVRPRPGAYSRSSLAAAVALGTVTAAVAWGLYIVLTQRVGDEMAGLQGLAISLPVAGLVATVVAGPSLVADLTPTVLLAGLGLAILLPVVPFALEMLALRRLTATAFGTLMSLEPALALLIGLIVLGQKPGLLPIAGIAFVVLAGIGAERTGARRDLAPRDRAALDDEDLERSGTPGGAVLVRPVEAGSADA
jgi:inner membrane transporter RhtA